MAVSRRAAMKTMAATGAVLGAAALHPKRVHAAVPPALPPQPVEWRGSNSQIHLYDRAHGYPAYDPHPRYLGELRGSWQQIGRQYGERAGDLIRLVYEGWYRELIRVQGTPAVMAAYLRQQQTYYEALVPEALELMQGIADGAGTELAHSDFPGELSHFDKILMINSYFGLQGKPPGAEQAALAPPEENTTCCSGAVMLGKATRDGKPIHCSSEDQHFFPQEYLVSFTAAPTDARAHRYTVTDSAGEIGSEHAMNDSGVVVSGYAGGGFNIMAPTLAEPFSGYRRPGLDWQVGDFYAAAFAGTAREAVELLTVGRPEYRAKSGRATVIGKCTRGANWVVSDRTHAFVVESIPADEKGVARYGMRQPGDLGERDAAFIVSTNNVEARDSFDERNQHDPAHPMNQHGSGSQRPSHFGLNGMGTRYWTFTWLIRNQYGQITPEMVEAWRRTHYFYDEQGTRHDTVDVNGKTVEAALAPGVGTLCRHTVGAPGEDTFKGINIYVSLSLAADLKCRRTKGRPCEWDGPWDEMTL